MNQNFDRYEIDELFRQLCFVSSDASIINSKRKGRWLPKKEHHPASIALMMTLICGWRRLKNRFPAAPASEPSTPIPEGAAAAASEPSTPIPEGAATSSVPNTYPFILDPVVLEEAFAMATELDLRSPNNDDLELHFYRSKDKLFIRKVGLIRELKAARGRLSIDIFPQEQYLRMLSEIKDTPIMMYKDILQRYPLVVHP
jgi:hypothetical protein